MTEPGAPPVTPVQRTVTVLAAGPDGAYTRLVLGPAPGTAAMPAARPGQFVALAVGGSPTAMLLRRCFSIASSTSSSTGTSTGTSTGSEPRGAWELLIAAQGPGSTWLTERRPGDLLDVVGPLGRGFPPPAASPGRAAACVLVAGGYGAAPIVWWARELVAAGHRVAVVIGAADAARLAEVDAARSLGVPVLVTTDDGTDGIRGRVTDVLPEAMDAVTRESGVRATAPTEVYACGPMAMLRAVTERGRAEGATVWCSVEEAMACGVGVCMTCVLPVRGHDGVTRMVRSCVEGPTFAGEAVRWDCIGATATLLGGVTVSAAVPSDCLGAPR